MVDVEVKVDENRGVKNKRSMTNNDTKQQQEQRQ
jgi:hypothetical protein